MATLNTHVGVHHPEHGSVLLSPGEDVPEWAIPLIENPDVWAVEPDESEGIATAPGEEPSGDDSSSDEAENSEDEEGSESSDEESEDEGSQPEESGESESVESDSVPIPPKAGPKGSAKAWAEYANAKGFAIEGDPGRDEIIAALESEGIATA